MLNTESQRNVEETILLPHISRQLSDIQLKQLTREDINIPDKSGKVKTTEFRADLLSLFHFTKNSDRVMACVAVLFTIGQGIILPFISLTVGDLTNALVQSSTQQIVGAISDKFLIMIYVGIAIIVTGYIAALFWNVLSARQTLTIKRLYFRKILRMKMGWFDKQLLNELPIEFANNINDFSASLSIKLHLYLMHFAIVLGGILISFMKGYLLTLILLGLTPLMFLFMFFFIRYIQKTEIYQKKHYSKAGSISSEAFMFIKTVKSLNGEEHEIKRYTEECKKSKNHAIKYGYIAGTLFGATFFSIYIVYALAFYISCTMINDKWINSNTGKAYQVGDLLTIFFANLISIFALGQISPLYKNLESGKNAAVSIRKVIETNEEEATGGIWTDKILGKIEFKNVSFAYPNSPDKLVLKNVSFTIEPGQKIALVGPSGCGKSTIIQLIERFYTPVKGKILLDGVDLNSYDLNNLRNRLGYVFQQPILFAKSIKYNVSLGSNKNDKMTDQVIWDSLEKALAKEFVDGLVDKLDYYVGSQGNRLSGGQKQRIAIARILGRKPDVWIFDEATSALDTENEGLIQNAIDSITEKTTSISIAHRLSTIRNAHKIFVMKDGQILESGTHKELISIDNGFYKSLDFLQGKNLDCESPQKSPQVSRKFDFSNRENNFKINMDLLEAKSPNPITKIDLDETLILNYSTAVKENKTPKQTNKIKVSWKSKKFGLSGFIRNEKKWIAFGIFASFLNGSIMPIVGYIMGTVLGYFQDLEKLQQGIKISSGESADQVTKRIYGIIIVAVGVSVASFIFNSLQYGFLNHAGEEYTANLRSKYFRKLIYQDMEYFDDIHHQPTDLANHLAEDCKTVNVLIGSFIGSIIQSLGSFGIGLMIAFIYSWRITLVLLGLSPIIFISGVMEALLLHQVKTKTKDGEFNIIGETIENIKVVKSLTAQEEILNEFDANCEAEKKKKIKVSLGTSLTIGYAQGSMFFVFAIVFRIGAVFLGQNTMDSNSFLITIFSIIIGLFGAGMAAQFLGTVGPAQAAGKIILSELNKESLIEQDPTGFFPSKNLCPKLKPEFNGHIVFQNVSFKYKTQKDYILKNINLTIYPGTSVAFAGKSGSGKSTIFQLLLRFYNVSEGAIYIDGIPITDFDVSYLRSIFGVVRQEPSLFSGTIKYNIEYNLSAASQDELLEVSDRANVSEFVFLYDQGFERDVGSFGSNLSGGQKQRICIARVLLRKSHILLLDEATSALDSQSELLVQNAIEKIGKSQTTMTIAHRVSTIKNSDIIYVFEDGNIVESGTFHILSERNGKFVELSGLH